VGYQDGGGNVGEGEGVGAIAGTVGGFLEGCRSCKVK
jgi:hypothetical protein